MAESSEARRYRIMGIVGKGGFGKVYRARLEGAEGFLKDVAIKLLNDEAEASEQVLQRFRDESRILGLLRDRAIITVDPPTRLGGRWAVVMEFVDGQSVSRLLKLGTLPPRVAAEIVGEVARALHKVYSQPGPDGEPLRLLHRDLKPENLQITPSGEVKILDFGIARAQFENREAHTTTNIGGTLGYIAPERLEGEEGPAGDIYSLGVVLQTMLTGKRPSRKSKRLPADHTDEMERSPGYDQVLALGREMAVLEPEDRPAAREVEDRCVELADSLSGEKLRRWAERVVPRSQEQSRDPLCGQLLTETMATVQVGLVGDLTPLPTDEGTGSVNRTATFALAGVLGTTALALAVVALTLGAAAGGWWFATKGGQTAEVTVAPVIVEVQAPAPVPVPEPAPVVVEPEPDPEPEPVARPRPRPKPTPAPPPARVATGKTFPVMFSSVPMGADVYIDGAKRGETPLLDEPVGSGEHTVRMVLGTDAIEHVIVVGKRAPTRYIWKGGDEWLVQY